MAAQPAPEAPRVGGYVTYRKPGQQKRRALIEWVHPGRLDARAARGRPPHDHYAARRRPRSTGGLTTADRTAAMGELGIGPIAERDSGSSPTSMGE